MCFREINVLWIYISGEGYIYISGEGWGVRKVHVLHEAMFRNLNDMGKLMTSGTKAKMIIDIVEGLNASKATECISRILD